MNLKKEEYDLAWWKEQFSFYGYSYSLGSLFFGDLSVMWEHNYAHDSLIQLFQIDLLVSRFLFLWYILHMSLNK